MMCGGLGHEGSEVTVDSLGMFILTYTNHFLQNPQVYLTYEKNMQTSYEETCEQETVPDLCC